jgi:hypothetical protein
MPAEYFKRLGIDEPPKDGDYFVGLSKYQQGRPDLQREELDALADQQSWAAKRPWTAEDYPHIAAWIKANDKPLAVIIEATKRTEYFNPLVARRKDKGPTSLIGALIPSVQKCREVASALAGRAMLRTGAGEFDDAWQDLLACHRLARLVARGASLIEALVGNAIDQIASQADLAYLECADLSGPQVRDCLKDLQALPPFPPLADQIDLFERFMYLEALQLMSRGADVVSGGESTAADKKAMMRIDWEPAFIAGNRWYDRLVAAMRHKDRAERKKALGQIENDLTTLQKNIPSPNVLSKLLLSRKARGKAIGDTFITLLMPAFSKVQDSRDRCEQTQRNLHMAFALAAYRADSGSYPAKLDNLAPMYLAAIPDDLFSGKAIVYHPAEQGYLLYSVGVNEVDDDGQGYEDEPPGDDLVVRMPLPELKRKK